MQDLSLHKRQMLLCCRCAFGLNIALLNLFAGLTIYNFVAAGAQTSIHCMKVLLAARPATSVLPLMLASQSAARLRYSVTCIFKS